MLIRSDRLNPKPHLDFAPIPGGRAAAEYVLSFDERGLSEKVRLGQDQELPFGPKSNGRDPSFLVEAGKPFTVEADLKVKRAAQLYGAQRVDLKVWTLGDPASERRYPIADGARDRLTGQLLSLPARVEVPPEASGTLFMAFEVTTKEGKVVSEWAPHYGAVIIPQNGATIGFAPGWQQQVEGQVQAGGRLQLGYLPARMKPLFDGQVPTEIVACLRLDRNILEVPVTTGAEGETVFLPAVRIPFEAKDIEVWFRGRLGDRVEYDSDHGKNYRFPVELAAPDADPHWKRHVLTMKGMDRLTADNFVAIAPTDQRYNCIAFSLGIRDQWVWREPASVQVFDQLYAEHGYRPLAGLELAPDPQLEKVALFAHGKVITHAARMDAQGRWMSKLGTDPVIRHDDVHVAGGKSYGEVVRVYARSRP